MTKDDMTSFLATMLLRLTLERKEFTKKFLFETAFMVLERSLIRNFSKVGTGTVPVTHK
jgi:hypothetical protein